MPEKNKTRFRTGKASVVAFVMLAFLVLVTGGVVYYAINMSPVGWRQEKTIEIPVKSETLATYLEDPSTCSADLDKTFSHVSFIPKDKEAIYDIKLTDDKDTSIVLNDVDLRVFIPKIPKIIQGDEFLTHLTLVQRELNRNDTVFRNTKYDDYSINIANNCLREGLWEAYINKVNGSNKGKTFHGWFEFPLPLYKKLFKSINGFELSPYETALQHYLRPDGKPVNIGYLREVKEEKEIPLDNIDLNRESPIVRMGEQNAKAKLVVNSGLHSFSDIYKAENQPVKLMQFDEPGIYKKKKLMKFDYSFLNDPTKVVLRKAYNPRLKESFNELEINFGYGNKNVLIKNYPFLVNRDGLKIVLGGWTGDDIPEATERPVPAKDFGRFTFGAGTPDIYVTYENRLKALEKANNIYLFALDGNSNYVDNHTLGLDQVYISRLQDGTFILYMVSYERIMLLAQWNFKPPEDLLVSSPTMTAQNEEDNPASELIDEKNKNEANEEESEDSKG